ncbi:hypothetical protein KGQ20_46300, partial [Catenulispora sp. NF23]|uniref:preprotein translocase subunit SecA n=1 Tax=Catenulispora pinistramenti TaxID=2705254 RepID=UPI001BA9D61A
PHLPPHPEHTPARPDAVQALEHEARLAAAKGAHDIAQIYQDIAARSGPGIPEHQRLVAIDDDGLKQLLLHGSQADSIAAVYEVVRRVEHKGLRWTQMSAVQAMSRGDVVNMAAGEGKSLVFLAYAARRAVMDGVDAVQVITTRDNLATREHERYSDVLKAMDINIVRMTPDGGGTRPDNDHPTIYVGTHEDVGFSYLRGKPIPGRHASVDEVDEAFVYANTTFILSEGAQKAAPDTVAKRVTDAWDFLDRNLGLGRLSPLDFGHDPDRPGGPPPALTAEGKTRVRDLLDRELTAGEQQALDMAATARWEYVENKHYVIHDDKVYIIDQTTHKVMFDPKTSTESRWNGGLAQAVEAKHGLAIRDDPSTANSVDAKTIYTKENYDTVVGASGTANGKSELFAKQGLSPDIADIPRYHESQLAVADDKVLPDTGQKLQSIAEDAIAMQEGTGQPQLILAHENNLVAELSRLLTDRGSDHVAIDAKWFLEKGVEAEAEFQRLVDAGGLPGKITVINMQGARGVDVPISKEAKTLGGLHVRVTARSTVSRDLDIQAENRAARNGEHGSVQYYL